jgi:hypothetical protein
MATIRVKAGDFSRVLRERLKADVGKMRNAAYEAVTRGEAEAVRLTNVEGLVDQGLYKRAWQSGLIPRGAHLYNDAPYAGVLEYGRRPGSMPPSDPIREWVIRKLVANGKVEPEDIEQAVYLIRWKIYQKGTKPHFILRDVYHKLYSYLSDAIVRELQR